MVGRRVIGRDFFVHDIVHFYINILIGFIFSDGEFFDLDISVSKPGNKTSTSTNNVFRSSMEEAFQYLHNDLAHNILNGIARRMQIPNHWFQTNLGPTQNASQWHVKRYVSSENNNHHNHTNNNDNDLQIHNESEQEILPMHTDPSLISIVIHDRPGQNPGGMGLQYLSTNPAPTPTTSTSTTKTKPTKTWNSISAHGHGVATIFTGSVLSLLTGGAFPAACHRVIKQHSPTKQTNSILDGDNERMAVTLFVRPFGKAMLQVPPSPMLMDPTEKKMKVKVKQMTFDAWNAKVARNYMKQTKKKQKEKNSILHPKNASSSTSSNTTHHHPCKTQTSEYFCDDYTELSILEAAPPLTGREKYLGGEVGNNNIIYTIPGHAKQVLAINPTTSTITPIGPIFHGEFKWLRAVKVPTTGVIYGIPCHANCILKIIPEKNNVSTFGEDVVSMESNPLWKWHGGVYSAHDGCKFF